MKRLRYTIYLLAVSLFVGCNTEPQMELPQQGSIAINLNRAALTTRAVASTESEAAVSHIDILFFDAQDALYYHERVSGLTPYQGMVYLSRGREQFPVGGAYNIYMVANSTHEATVFATLDSRNALLTLTQQDENIHLTAITGVDGAPTHFLMDGQAYLTSLGAEPAVKDAIVINDGTMGGTTEISCTLRRAAAKVVVTLNKGSQVNFDNSQHAGYYFRNMPYSTLVVDQYEMKAELRTPAKSASPQFFYWAEDNSSVTVVGYFYSHDRKNDNFFERGTSLIVNIPLTYTRYDEATAQEVVDTYENCYYQLQLSRTGAFERNHIYYVSATINAPGAEEISEPVIISDMHYYEREWVETEINVGGEAGPKYLKVNREKMEMHNVAVDSQTLVFASSDPITIDITNVYYIDKFGQTQNITSELSDYNIGADPLSELAGNIEVRSDVPTNNTIRYIEMRVFQDDNGNGVHDQGELYKDVLVLQYPLIYVTNIVGWYSYRDDFKTTDSNPTTYQYKGNNIVRVGLQESNDNWTGNYVYNSSNYYFWRSKVADDPATSGDNAGKSVLYYYSWDGNEISTSRYGYQNCRMYHVRVTATSGDYTVGRPRITNNITDAGEDNAKLVSPSFMIASRLGFVTTGDNIGMVVNDNEDRHTVFADHCREYVEVCKDSDGNAIVYDDWRLPTDAELRIIMDLQGTSSQNADAIDYLLNAVFYESASGRTFNTKNDKSVTNINNYTGNSYSVRCVRDAY